MRIQMALAPGKSWTEVESGDNHYPPDSFTSRGNASLFCNTEQVERISQEKGCLINALARRLRGN